MNEQTIERSSIEPQTTAVIYEPKTGEIVGYHHFAAAPGADIPSRAEMEHIALSGASEGEGRGTTTANAFAILFAEPSEIDEGVDYRVSANGRLVAAAIEAAVPPRSS